MRGVQFEIITTETKLNGKFECYNITESMVHLARIGNNGSKLSCKNKDNLVNIPITSFAVLTSNNNIELI